MFKRSQLTETVIGVLRGVNDEISYSELAKRAKVSVPDVKKVISSAKKVLMDEKILFESIVGYGLERLTDSGKILRSEKNKKRLKSGSKRSIKELNTIHNYNELSHDDQIKATINRTLFELILREPEPVKEEPQPTQAGPSTNIIHIPKIK